MAKNEDGEFELILGNRQLLSVFFIVVVLLGVFFTMGYIVGRNSNPVAPPEVVASHKESKPVVIEGPPRENPKASTPAAAAPTETAAQLPPKEEPKPEPPKPEPAKAEPPKPQPTKREPPKPEPVKSEPVKAPPTKAPPPKPVKQAPPATASGSAPSSGETYLQLVATAKAEADVMLDVLRKKGFKAVAVQIPERPELYRVFVGPMADTAVNKTRSDLQGAGFPGDKAIRKTF
jgi:outer membrane biosynthesis protein TonB